MTLTLTVALLDLNLIFELESDKIGGFLLRTLPRTVRVPFKTYGSNRHLSEIILG